MTSLNEIIAAASSFVWGPIMLALLFGTGIFLTVGLRFRSWRKLPLAMKLVFTRDTEQRPGHISSFQALMTALSSTVGTGNIAGVATAIAIGGPGAMFWMWICALFGMATKYAEAVLAVKYRHTNPDGELMGGPMWYISNGLGLRRLGWLFALFGSLAAFGIGNMVQANSVADVLRTNLSINPWITGVVMSVMTGLVLVGGIKRIGKVAARLVPFMVLTYMGAAASIIVLNIDRIPGVFSLIFTHAFSPISATGGFVGATVARAVQLGVARGVFSNEAGLGSAPIVHAVAQTNSPVRQGLIAMNGTFIDTIIVCTMTGIIILLNPEVWTSGQTAAPLSSLAFETALPGLGSWVVTAGLILFAYSTIIGWSYYGESCVRYLCGARAQFPYRCAFCLLVIVGACIKVDLVWNISDVMNGAMAIPNLVGLVGLSGVVFKETRQFFSGE